MNTRTKTILMAVALSAAATALSSQAADQNAYFDQQREITEGYTSSPFVPTQARTKPATAYQAMENNWFTAERDRTSGNLPSPLPVAATSVASKARPTSLSQVAQDKAWQDERRQDDGYQSAQ